MGISAGSTVSRHKLDYHRCFGKRAYANHGSTKYNYDWESSNLSLRFLLISIRDYNFITFCLSFFHLKQLIMKQIKTYKVIINFKMFS